jgi:hypothetical protein
LPKIPTPTCAFKIILTSFAPSPIDKVFFSGNLYLIIITISAFYFGETRQANTAYTLSLADKNISESSLLQSISTKDAPDTIIACF